MRNLFKTILFLGISITVTACQKSDDVTADPAQASIILSSPTDGQVFKKGDVIQMNADVSYITEMHGYELKIINKATGAELYKKEEHTHGDKFAVSQSWTDTLSDAAELKVQLTVVLDHDNTAAQKEVSCKSQP